MLQRTFRKRHSARHMLVVLPLVLAACVSGPDLPPRKAGVHGETPQLLPIAAIMAQTADGPHTARLDATPEARVAALRARAARLRGPVIAPAQRQDMLASDSRLR